MTKRSLAILCCLFWGSAVSGLAVDDAAPLLVRVTDDKGRPLAGVTVRVALEHHVAPPEPEIREETSPEGIARISHLRPGSSYWVIVERQGFAPEHRSVSPETMREMRITLRPASVRRGRVVDEQGRPVTDAEVELSGEPFGLSWAVPPFLESLVRQRTRTDAAGRFRFRDLPDAEFELTIRHPGHATLVADRRIQGSAKGLVGTFVLRQGVSLRGIVTSEDGLPVGGARIWAQPDLETEMSESPPRTLAATSAADGTFSIPHLKPGWGVLLEVCATGFSETSDLVIVPNSPEKPLQFQLESGASIRGRVLAPDGWPVAGATVHASRIPRIDECFPSDSICNEPVTTDMDGRFHLTGLWPAEYKVTARAPGMADVEDSVKTGDELELHLGKGFTVAGRALDLDGRPFPGAKVWIEEKSWMKVMTQEDGSFRIEGVATGQNLLQAEAVGSNGYRVASQRIDVPESEIWIDLVLTPEDQ